jgi:hypothetical protein
VIKRFPSVTNGRELRFRIHYCTKVEKHYLTNKIKIISILGKPDPKVDDEEEDELKEKAHVSMDQLNQWEKNFINMPVSEMFPLLIAGT